MTYDIYFHNDFDGRASAAVMLAFLRSRGNRIAHYVPIDHDLAPQWRKDDFFKKHRLFHGARHPAIVVDFTYHAKAAWWFDHHATAFKREDWRQAFRPDEFHYLEPEYRSCCHLVYDMLKKNFGWKPPRHMAELVKWLDVIDAARYRSAKQTIAMKEPALAIDAFIEGAGAKAPAAARMVQWLAERTLAEIARVPAVKRAAALARVAAKKNLSYYRNHLEVRGAVTAIDLTEDRNVALRYAPYFLYPKSRYNVRLARKGELYSIGVGANPWMRGRNKIHIGKFLKRYGGGGHKDAGGAEFATHKQAERAREEVVALLNK